MTGRRSYQLCGIFGRTGHNGMHPYGVETKNRARVFFLIFAASVGLALGLDRVLRQFSLNVPWWVDAPSVLGFFWPLYELFDRRIWKAGFLRSLGLVKTPDFSGRWKGHLHSYGEIGERTIEISLTIRQTWTRICVRLEGEHSRSRSIVGAIAQNEPDRPMLVHTYQNEPKAGAIGTMHSHRGTAWLTLTDDGQLLEGEYYTGRDRRTHGSIDLERVDS